jgi:hypothetical protein
MSIQDNYFFKMGVIALFLFFLGEVIYLREIILNPNLLKQINEYGNITFLGEYVRQKKIIGLSSLNNLFLIPTAIFGSIANSFYYPIKYKRKSKNLLIVIGIVILIHSLFFAARMFFIYFIIIVSGTWVIGNSKKDKSIKKYYIASIFTIIIIIIGELFRSGLIFSRRLNIPLFSVTSLYYSINILLQAYLASDFNNALVLLSSKSSLQLISTSVSLANIINKLLGINFIGYNQISNWSSNYGTVNIIGLWWYDWGWYSLFIAFFSGLFFGLLYKMFILNNQLRVSIGNILFLISLPGFYSISRINYFGLSIYLLNLFYVILMFFIKSIAIKKKKTLLGAYNGENLY